MKEFILDIDLIKEMANNPEFDCPDFGEDCIKRIQEYYDSELYKPERIKQRQITDKEIAKLSPSTPTPSPKPQVLSPFDQFLKDNEVCDNNLCRKIKEVYNNKVEEAKKAGGCNSCKMNAIKRSMATYIEAYKKFLATRQKSSCTSGTCALTSPTEKQ